MFFGKSEQDCMPTRKILKTNSTLILQSKFCSVLSFENFCIYKVLYIQGRHGQLYSDFVCIVHLLQGGEDP